MALGQFTPIIVKEILSQYPKVILKKAKNIKAIFFDVDGVLTDGKLMYTDNGLEIKSFNVKDGQIVAHLKKAGLLLGAISGRESGSVSRRCAELKLDFCHQGIVDKAEVFNKLMDHHKIKSRQVVYIGDDINDLGVFKLAGFCVCPSDAPAYIKSKADLITFARGGEGVLREVGDLILAVNGALTKIAK